MPSAPAPDRAPNVELALLAGDGIGERLAGQWKCWPQPGSHRPDGQARPTSSPRAAAHLPDPERQEVAASLGHTRRAAPVRPGLDIWRASLSNIEYPRRLWCPASSSRRIACTACRFWKFAPVGVGGAVGKFGRYRVAGAGLAAASWPLEGRAVCWAAAFVILCVHCRRHRLPPRGRSQ